MIFDIPKIINDLPTKNSLPYSGFQKKIAYKIIKKVHYRTVASERQNHRCCFCGVHMNFDEPENKYSCTAEHIIPKSQGGPDHINNFVASCWTCNQKRGTMDVEEFYWHLDRTFCIIFFFY